MKLSAKVVALTFVGGALGTLIRFSLNQIPGYIFVNFWIANLAGAVLIAIFNNHPWFAVDNRRAFFTVGFTGGLTTMSGLSALMFFSPLEVLVQALAGLALYLAISAQLKRRFHA